MENNKNLVPLAINVGVYYYEDDNKIVIDEEEMLAEFEAKLKELVNMFSKK
jgi:hypothetical protein